MLYFFHSHPLVSLLLALLAFIPPLYRFLRRLRRPQPPPPPDKFPSPLEKPASFLVILGSGGHTAEMLTLLQTTLPTFPNAFVTYITTHTDRHSLPRALAFHRAHFAQNKFDHVSVPRAREVGQGALSSAISSFKCIRAVWRVVRHVKADVVLTNGPATGAIVGAVAVLNECLGGKKVKLIYIESLARVETMSVSGRLMYHVADRILVQWPELLQRYPRAEFYGRLC